MRSSIAAQSCASVPPDPAWMSMKHDAGSIGLLNIRRNSMPATRASIAATSVPTAWSVASSLSARASANNSALSLSPASSAFNSCTIRSSAFFSLPSSCARLGSSQIFGSSSSRSTSASRTAFTSKSKIPPQIGGASPEILEFRSDLIELLGFHCVGSFETNANYSRSALKPLPGHGFSTIDLGGRAGLTYH